MITTKKLYELFESQWLMQRQNPGGESPYLKKRLLGFVGTINILDALNLAKEGVLKLKIGNGAVQVRTVDFTDVNPEELTPADAADILDDAGFTGCEFAVDAETGRLKLAALDVNVKWLQIYGDLAAALRFGNCQFKQGKGSYLWASMDGDLKSAAETENWEENTEITNESTLGAPVKVTIPGKRSGTSFVLTDRISSRSAQQMINGGIWLSGSETEPERYEPPSPSDSETRRVDVFTFSKIFDKNNNSLGSEAFVRERMYIGCVGRVIRSGGAGSFNDSEYSLTADSYTDEGIEKSSPRISDYTQSQWEALGMNNVIVTDWENA